jgi:hypothetical protein
VHLVVMASFGFLLLLIAWIRTASLADFDRQLSWVNCGGFGLVVGGVALGRWVLIGRQRVTDRGRDLFGQISGWGSATGAEGVPSGEFVATDEMTRYHSPQCLLVARKPTRARSLTAHRSAGRRPCEVCRP